MDFLSHEQISFVPITPKNDPKDSFKLGFISRRLYYFMRNKINTSEWKVFQIPIMQRLNFPCYASFPEYNAVLTSPTKGSILVIKNKE